MAHYTDAKCRLCRREGVKLYLKGARCYSPKCPIERRGGQVPGQHGKKYTRRLSEYGRQLREKQKVKRLYSVLERQFVNYYKEAAKTPGNTGLRLLQLLESRLDNTLMRSGLVPSRSIARQLITHGHVQVDNKKVDIPSYRVKADQVLTLSPKALKLPEIKEQLESKEAEVAPWVDRKAAAAKISRLPERDEIKEDINEQLIIEYYSR